jgi:hypothetical protein
MMMLLLFESCNVDVTRAWWEKRVKTLIKELFEYFAFIYKPLYTAL